MSAKKMMDEEDRSKVLPKKSNSVHDHLKKKLALKTSNDTPKTMTSENSVKTPVTKTKQNFDQK